MSTNNDSLTVGIEASDVVQYLKDHPDFFVHNGNLLSELTIPHQRGSTISLVERQVAVLREKNSHNQQQLTELIDIARDNARLNAHLQTLSLKFMENESISDVLTLLNASLCHDFSADAVTLFLMMEEGQLACDDIKSLKLNYMGPDKTLKGFEKIILAGKPHCSRFTSDQRSILFADRAQKIASAVVLPLIYTAGNNRHILGLLAIGSCRQDRYHAQMGTIFLKYLAELLSRRLRPFAQS